MLPVTTGWQSAVVPRHNVAASSLPPAFWKTALHNQPQCCKVQDSQAAFPRLPPSCPSTLLLPAYSILLSSGSFPTVKLLWRQTPAFCTCNLQIPSILSIPLKGAFLCLIPLVRIEPRTRVSHGTTWKLASSQRVSVYVWLWNTHNMVTGPLWLFRLLKTQKELGGSVWENSFPGA